MSAPAMSLRAAQAKLASPESVAPHLRCNSCSQPVFNSYQTPHGCRLCQRCYDTKLSDTEKCLCPGTTEACRDEEEGEIKVSRATCFPDIATRRDIGKLQVHCPNHAAGCDARIAWREVDAHLENCNFESVDCDQCGQPVVKKQLEQHRAELCSKRLEKCTKCSQLVVHDQLQSLHYSLESESCCPSYRAACPHCGSAGRQLTRQLYVEHLPACPDRPAPCKFAHIGCSYRGKASDLEKHYCQEADAHLTLMDRRLREIAQPKSPSAAASAAAAVPAASTTAAASPDLAELQKKFNTMYEMFKKLQINVANWAHTTLEFEQLAEKFGGVSQFRGYLKGLDDKLRSFDSSSSSAAAPLTSAVADSRRSLVDSLQHKLVDMEFRLLNLETTNYDGQLIWKVANLAARRREARDGRVVTIYSQPFFSRQYGHQFRASLSLNGADEARGRKLSAGLVVMQSDYDDALDWPLVASVTFKLLGVRGDRLDDVVRTEELDTKARRPQSREDLSMGVGVKDLLALEALDSSDKFVKNDSLFLEVKVDSGAAAGVGSSGGGNRRGKRK